LAGRLIEGNRKEFGRRKINDIPDFSFSFFFPLIFLDEKRGEKEI